jgi:folate-dependent phosphoribosylglycinamide formyltransferase PurN
VYLVVNLFLLVIEEPLFYPRFLDGVLRHRPEDARVIGAALVPAGESRKKALRHLLRVAGPVGVGRLAARGLRRQLTDGVRDGRWNVRSVLRRHAIPVETVPTPNDPTFVASLAARQPDVVICAVPNILRDPILAVPTLGCINRHAGRLPDYRGVEPVFHALRQGEQAVSVTYHKMVRQIDAGVVLWEHAELVRPDDRVYGLYERLFTAAEQGFWPAVRQLEQGGGRLVDPGEGRYYTWPTPEEIAAFRARGRRYI